MKKWVSQFMCFVMAAMLMVAQTGVPIYKMICTKDGHVEVSVQKSATACNDDEINSCCSSNNNTQQTKQTDCCDTENAFAKLSIPAEALLSGKCPLPAEVALLPIFITNSTTSALTIQNLVSSNQFVYNNFFSVSKSSQSKLSIFRI
jgi:hypothetical protein